MDGLVGITKHTYATRLKIGQLQVTKINMVTNLTTVKQKLTQKRKKVLVILIAEQE